ncbi:MAG: monovalent cation/H+ antiporter complex subunit F [Microthrixaceae bacterium]
MTVVFVIAFALLGTAALVALVFVARAGNLVDRAVGLDLMASVMVNALAVGVAVVAGGDAVDLILLWGLLAFLGNVAVARFVERRGSGS